MMINTITSMLAATVSERQRANCENLNKNECEQTQLHKKQTNVFNDEEFQTKQTKKHDNTNRERKIKNQIVTQTL
jgi:hypothetical protein